MIVDEKGCQDDSERVSDRETKIRRRMIKESKSHESDETTNDE
jgi:hypothetical protein